MEEKKGKRKNNKSKESLIEWMNTFKSLYKTQEVLIRRHMLTELQLYNSFENKLTNGKNLLVLKDLPNNYRSSLPFQVPRGNLIP